MKWPTSLEVALPVLETVQRSRWAGFELARVAITSGMTPCSDFFAKTKLCCALSAGTIRKKYGNFGCVFTGWQQ